MPGGGPIVSIVEDDEPLRGAIESLLRSLGYPVQAFASAEDYLCSPRLEDTSCLISDVHMPGMNGLELQRHLRRAGHRTPVIFMTAFPDEKVRRSSLDAGAICFLTKPFDDRALIECLDRALKVRQ